MLKLERVLPVEIASWAAYVYAQTQGWFAHNAHRQAKKKERKVFTSTYILKLHSTIHLI